METKLENIDTKLVRLNHAVFGVNGETGILSRVEKINGRIDRLVIAILLANTVGASIGVVVAKFL